ncbi:alpha/beta hydrolase domain-containing protein [Methylobacterium dankookense]|uniref:Alpha/beta hydrolase domain-containing protein n=1 Tax=Methylobacterium dankookense TaxID=560405 RepID=A0A564FXT2_9HYPH|nr:alpha/beta hydrolase domain-containing protein [Methylobacterium dankookense]GJD55649.1 hypothetical protein IFDJLNFL_1536 [Methylobacterium dankookense]VUF12797.1 hypothetical protein MTDSW087_02492 [Methylobacterium dankookense]
MLRRCSRAAGLAIGLAAVTLGGPAQARVTRLELASPQPFGTFRAGDYLRFDGRVVGELSPDDHGIPDLDKAQRNEAGRVAYSARIILIAPADPAAGNGTLLVDVPNRGRAYANALYNSPRAVPMLSGDVGVGTGFLQDRGFAVAEIYWELGRGADLPSFVDGEGRRRFVEGVGFAIVRDAADFLAHAAADGAGTRNPLAGTISRTLGTGKSQDGRFLKTFLLDGFNMAEGRRVFDGMHVFVSGAGLLPIMQSGTGPGSSADGTPNFADPDFPGVHDGPLTIGEIVAKVEARGEIPPRMMLLNSTVDYASLRASLGRTGAHGTADLPLPANVRMYDVAGSSHVNVLKADACRLPPGRLDWAPVARATLVRLDQWVARNAAPPETRLMPVEPATGDPAVLQAPRNLPDAVVQVPKRDPDGNPIGGVRLPDIAVPLGIHGGQNAPLTSFTCSLVGTYRPFARVQADGGDGRPSLAERYRDRSDYVNRVHEAARAAEQQGFLLAEDVAVILNAAAEVPIPEPKAEAAPPR